MVTFIATLSVERIQNIFNNVLTKIIINKRIKAQKTLTSILAHLAVKLTFAQIRITANYFVWEKYKSENLTREVHCVGMAWNVP